MGGSQSGTTKCCPLLSSGRLLELKKALRARPPTPHTLHQAARHWGAGTAGVGWQRPSPGTTRQHGRLGVQLADGSLTTTTRGSGGSLLVPSATRTAGVQG